MRDLHPTSYDHLLAEDPFDDIPPPPPTEGSLPLWHDMGKAWHEGGRPAHAPFPNKYKKLVDRLLDQAGDESKQWYSWGWHAILKRVENRTSCDENFWVWEGFHFGIRKYSGITQIDIEIPGFPVRQDSSRGFDTYYTSRTSYGWDPVPNTRILIWRGNGCRSNEGWRDGPWWEKLEALPPELEATTTRLAREHARKEEAAKRAYKAAEDAPYAEYLRKLKG